MENGVRADAPPSVRRPLERVSAQQQALLNWGREQRRDLPWRDTRDPWAILVSELMLQQTQVARVVPKYHAFLKEFPTTAACADAPVAAVVRAWAGLGYNRRAISLHRAARMIGSNPFPDTLEDLLALPGVGPYTARAVLTFAFERDVGVLEVNTTRVVMRLTGAAATQASADALVPSSKGWAWNQALIDLGATVCLRRTPRCEVCPVRRWCRAPGAEAPPPTFQSRFDGSDRQGRGRLVDALRSAAVQWDDVPAVMGWPDDRARAQRVAAGVIRDGLADADDSHLALAHGADRVP
jgi:A/G-specific adenine glycosylase